MLLNYDHCCARGRAHSEVVVILLVGVTRRDALEWAIQSSQPAERRFASCRCWPWFAVFFCCVAACVQASVLEDARNYYFSGNYTGCIAAIEGEMKDGAGGEERHLLLSKALLAVGEYPEALRRMTNALEEEPQSVRLKWQAREVFLSNGLKARANRMVDDIVQRVAGDPREYREPENLVVFGQAALLRNADPKRVLDQLLESAKKAEPKLREVYLAGGNLALEKHDFQLAGKRFAEGLKVLPDDPELLYGMAQAYAPGDSTVMQDAIESVLKRNSNHVGCLLLLVDNKVDAEDYKEAEKLLDQIKTINPWHPDAWAYRAVLAHLQNQPDAEARETGLKFAHENPRVDYLMGLKLSQKYRFAEGAGHQRQALKFEPDYLPAKAQLAQDLLRLGEEGEGWALADEVQKQDGYDVVAYNLMNLHQTMAKFSTLTNAHFLLRMGSHEAALYGGQVLELLERARSNLCAKYGMDLKQSTIVEVFPEQKDFAVRTFGMPGNPGYLGVCFGRVVTANSPHAQKDHPVNWQAVLYHEFCHVVTLQMTRNKMPRWLSEGISVYEESQENPSWGQHMTPDYREIVLGDKLSPVSKLSGAFLNPETDEDIQFAYYESSIVVKYLVQKYGLDALKSILHDLGEGLEINETIAKHTVAMDQLEDDFAKFIRNKAENLAPGLDFDKPGGDKEVAAKGRRKGKTDDFGGLDEEGWKAWAKSRPTNFWVMMRDAQQFVEDKKWAEAKDVLEKVVQAFPTFVGPDSAYRLLASAYRNLGETNAEKEILQRFAEKDDEATD
ncbi:MAG TPA: tetratricopeptide repeat protein, partial [Candidatus Dormibacteraeota bacterium]|nr:tetratricopeptide repeat protein [Candidatus Dormibacteraeota bacterium]